jgi:hypothetical protein
MENLYDPQTIIAISTGILLTISEALPFLKTDSNGLIHLLVNVGKSVLKNPTTLTTRQSEEREPLLPTNSLVIDFEPITSTLTKTTQDTLSTIQKQSSLKTPDKYQLEYIIQFIKSNYPKKQLEIKYLTENNKTILEDNHYRVNFDSIRDTFLIEW